jgi:DNA sulfur modification protein DndB
MVDLENEIIGKKKKAIAFEQEILDLFKNLEFDNSDGARDNFMIGGHQIDVCAGWEDTLLVIECKTSQEAKKKNLKSFIYEFKGKIKEIKEGFKLHPKYKKYLDYRFLLVINDKIILRPEDKEYANGDPPIYILNSDALKYYNDLYSYLKPYAKYDLLGELHIKPVQQNPISVPAFMVNLGKLKMYTFVINPYDLLEIAYVARRERGLERYYQRIVDKERIRKIAKYINGGGRFPNNIILSLKGNIKFKPIKKGDQFNLTDWPYFGISYGILEFPKDYRSCWIIDGQHRLYSFVNVNKDNQFNMPITAFENIDLETQGKFFLDINKNQKPVDPDLLWDLNGDMVPSEIEGRISNAVKYLNDNGHLYHKIFVPSSGIKKKISLLRLSGLCIAIKEIKLASDFTPRNVKNLLYDIDPQKNVVNIGKALSEYFERVRNIFNNQWELENKGYLLTNGGVTVLIWLYGKILERIIIKENRQLNINDLNLYLSPLKDLFDKEYNSPQSLKSLRNLSNSSAGRKEILRKFILKIRKDTQDNSFAPEIELIDYMKELKELEMKFKDIIKKEFYKEGNKDWFKNISDRGMYEKAVKRMEREGITDIAKIHLQIGLGECIWILREHKNIFYPKFINQKHEFCFSNESLLEGAFSHITSFRPSEAHYTGKEQKYGDEDLFKIYLKKLKNCLELALRN